MGRWVIGAVGAWVIGAVGDWGGGCLLRLEPRPLFGVSSCRFSADLRPVAVGDWGGG